MPSPSQTLSTLRPDLAQSFMQFDLAMAREGYIAPLVCPVMDVASASGNFGIIPIEQMLQSPDTARSPGSGYKRGNFTFKPSTYVTAEHGWEEPIDDNEASMYANYFDAEMLAAQRAYHFVLQAMEKRVADLFFSTANFSATYQQAASVAWATSATTVPLTDIEAAVLKVYTNSGLWPNALIVNRKNFRKLRNAAQIIDRVKYSGFMDTRAGNITAQAIAQCIDLAEVIVAGGTVNSANEGQSASLGSLWSDSYAMVAHIDRSVDFRRPTVARAFHWGADGSTIGGTVESYRDERVRGDVVRVRNQTHEKLLYVNVGCLITGI